jgi:type IV pilus assembly protein PilY1
MNAKLSVAAMTLLFAGIDPLAAEAQATQSSLNNYVQENFSGTATTNKWYFFNGACLTAGGSSAVTSPGTLPACVGDAYYNGVTLVGGNSGALQTAPDSAVQSSPNYPGVLRLTNDSNSESGAIISDFAFPLATYGLSVTFTTETYEGDSGGGNNDGADGISFFLQNASVPIPTLGDWGGSLGYTCSNVNNSTSQGYDGMIGGYLALGIDEYGNFLNGTTNTATGAFVANADNTSSGYGYVPNRVGLRGAGSTAWSYLSSNTTSTTLMPNGTAAYYPTALSSAQQLAAVQQACQTGYVWDYRLATTSADTTVTTNGVPNPYSAIPHPALTLPNYAAIPNAFKVLTTKIAVEGATVRGYGSTVTPDTSGKIHGIPITYNLSITTAGLLSLSYSFNGGAFQSVISQQQIQTGNSSIPANVRFGFAGSTGGSRNIHEIMCFQAIPQNASSSSAGLNQKQTAKVQAGTQVYFAFYNANNWTGSVTSQYLDTPPNATNPNDLQIDPAVNWDASCVLTGVATGQTCAKTGAAGPIKAEAPSSRNILTWNGAKGVPFEWSGLTSTQQGLLDAEEEAAASPITAWRLNYLRGARDDEQNAAGVDPNPANPTPPIPGGLRARTSVLGDIIDSSPTWVGPPNAGYPNIWKDLLYPSQTLPENTGTNTYGNYATAGTPSGNNEQQRLNVVYSGANDGLLHGFETGSFDSKGNYLTANNDGTEVIAYMPGYVMANIDDSFSTTTTTTGSTTTTTYATNVSNDFSSTQYGHRFSVDAPPGTGDLFYNGTWHSWLIGGMGPGGKAIYALDISDPTQFSEGNASTLVIGEWSNLTTATPTTQTTTTTTGKKGNTVTTTTTAITGLTPTVTNTLPCVGDTSSTQCASNLGNTYGVPQIRRFHNGQWGAILGNGLKSTSGDAGIYVMLVSGSGSPPTVTFYYLSTGWAAGGKSGNGIYYVTPADLDGDHITDYVYAGDLQGNVWRFDLTNSNPLSWAVTPNPIFTTAGGSQQPITTKLVVASIAASPNPRVLVEFGTGQQTAFTNNAAAAYASSQAQALYGIWDWNMAAWNSKPSTKYAYLSSSTTPAAPSSSAALAAAISGTTQMQLQRITGSYSSALTGCGGTSGNTNCTEYFRTVSNSPICWADTGTANCTGTSPTAQYGWYLVLDSGYANPSDANDLAASYPYNPTVFEQILFNPTLEDGAFIVNTTIPPTNSLRACASTSAGGWTMAINPATGGAFTNSFFGDANHNFQNINGLPVSGIALNGTGSVSVVAKGTSSYVVTQTVSGTGAITAINPPGGTKGSRLTWIQKR